MYKTIDFQDRKFNGLASDFKTLSIGKHTDDYERKK